MAVKTTQTLWPAAQLPEIEQEAARVHSLLPDAAKRTVLLLGGGGYVGTAVADYLLDAGYDVRCVDNFLYGHEKATEALEERQGYCLLTADFRDRDQMDAMMAGVSDVVILAGLVGDPITKKYEAFSTDINLAGMSAFIDALPEYRFNKLIFISTCSNYGLMPEGELAEEGSDLKPLSLYATHKVATEQKILSLRGKVDYTATVLRFATAFGSSPRMRFDLTVNEFTRELATGNELVVFDADTWRPYCHVRDFAELIDRTLQAPKSSVDFEVFNAGGDANNYTKRMLVEAICDRVPGAKVRYQEHGGDPRNYRVNFAKVKTKLGFEPSYSVLNGIDEVIEAVANGQYRDLTDCRNFHGNYEIASRFLE